MLAEPVRWSHARGNPVAPSPWQTTDSTARMVKGPILTTGGVTVLMTWFLFPVPTCRHFNV